MIILCCLDDPTSCPNEWMILSLPRCYPVPFGPHRPIEPLMRRVRWLRRLRRLRRGNVTYPVPFGPHRPVEPLTRRVRRLWRLPRRNDTFWGTLRAGLLFFVYGMGGMRPVAGDGHIFLCVDHAGSESARHGLQRRGRPC